MVIRSKSRINPLAFLLMLALTAQLAAAPPASQKSLADSMEKKVNLVRDNGVRGEPQKKVTVFSQDEINAYFAERRLKMPDGVKTVTFDLSPDRVVSRTRVDFDEITRERRSRNPLMYLFNGMHNVEVVARTSNAGVGFVHVTVESVVIDGVTVPRMALEFFIERFVAPKYPTVGLDRSYQLPSKMKSVVIGSRKGTVTQ
jgi:hypothetical protein